jgi:hypothetical protein
MTANTVLAEPYPGFTEKRLLRAAGWELDRECAHREVIQTIAPSARTTSTGAHAENIKLTCQDCWQVLDLRLWRPEAGGWYLKLRERFAAGRRWTFRYEGQTWIAIH